MLSSFSCFLQDNHMEIFNQINAMRADAYRMPLPLKACCVNGNPELPSLASNMLQYVLYGMLTERNMQCLWTVVNWQVIAPY